MKKTDCLKLREDIIEKLDEVIPEDKKNSYIFMHSIDQSKNADDLFSWGSSQGDVGDLILGLMEAMRKDMKMGFVVKNAAKDFDKYCLLCDGFITDINES